MTNANYRIEKMEITSRENNRIYGIALGHNEKSGMWVTWGFKTENMGNDDFEINYFWGHYYERENDALIDYHQRILDDIK